MPAKEVFTADEVAIILGTSASTLSIKLGSKRRWLRKKVYAWLNQKAAEAPSQTHRSRGRPTIKLWEDWEMTSVLKEASAKRDNKMPILVAINGKESLKVSSRSAQGCNEAIHQVISSYLKDQHATGQ